MTTTMNNERYSRVVRAYKKRFGELPSMLFNTGPAIDLCLDLMEQAIQGKRGRVTNSDLGYPPGADV